MKKQHEEETARSSTVVTPTPPLEAVALDPQQQEMIEKLVAARQTSGVPWFPKMKQLHGVTQ